MFPEAFLWIGFGLIFGSFTNVLILRQGTTRGLGGRSACGACGTSLQWFELIPIFSWIVLRGRCRTCASRISFQYPLVEILVAAGFLAVGFAPIPLLARILGCAIVVLLVAIAVYDLRHMLMPDRWVFAFGGLALASSLYLLWHARPEPEWPPHVFILIAGPAVAAPLWLLWYVSRGAWMGLGDVKFALAMGWLLGVLYGYVALIYSFVIGAIVGVAILLPLDRIVRSLRRLGITRFGTGNTGITMKSEVPFGPFLILGTCIVWFSLLYSVAPALDLLGDLVLWS